MQLLEAGRKGQGITSSSAPNPGLGIAGGMSVITAPYSATEKCRHIGRGRPEAHGLPARDTG